MNRSEEIIRDSEIDAERERTRQRIWGAPVGGKRQMPVGMGNFAGWGASAALIGALLGGVAGQGLGGAILGARWLAARPLPGMSAAEKRQRFEQAWRVFGRSALILTPFCIAQPPIRAAATGRRIKRLRGS